MPWSQNKKSDEKNTTICMLKHLKTWKVKTSEQFLSLQLYIFYSHFEVLFCALWQSTLLQWTKMQLGWINASRGRRVRAMSTCNNTSYMSHLPFSFIFSLTYRVPEFLYSENEVTIYKVSCGKYCSHKIKFIFLFDKFNYNGLSWLLTFQRMYINSLLVLRFHRNVRQLLLII